MSRALLGAGAAVLVLAASSPLHASWVVPGGGGASSTAAVLGAPSGLTARAAGTGEVTVSWRAPSGVAPDAYVVRRDGRVVTSCAPRTATSCTDDGLAEGTAYTYTVSAGLQRWVGSASAPASVRTRPADTTPPAVTALTRSQASPTAAASVGWTVAFSEAVTGVDASDFALTATTDDAEITSVTGSGARWAVRATTGSGSGHVGLELVDDDTVVDAAAHPLGGPGTGDGSVAGVAYDVDRTAPTVTIEQSAGQADPADTAPLRWTVLFSEPVTGVAADDLVRSSGSGGTLSVLGSGTAYEVTLGGPLSDGATSLAVRAGAATDAVGTASAASTSSDSSITYRSPQPTASVPPVEPAARTRAPSPPPEVSEPGAGRPR